MGKTRKPKQARAKTPTPSLPISTQGRDVAAFQHALYYAHFSECRCEACKALRPLAKKFIEKILGGG